MAEGNHWNKSLIRKAKMTGSYSNRDLIMSSGKMGFSELCWFAHRQRPTKESQSKGPMPWNDSNLEQEIKWYLIGLKFNQTIHTERNCVINCQSSLLRKASWSTEQFIEYTDIFLFIWIHRTAHVSFKKSKDLSSELAYGHSLLCVSTKVKYVGSSF